MMNATTMKKFISISIVLCAVMLLSPVEVLGAGTPAGTVIQSRSRVTFSTRSGAVIDTVYSAYISIVVSQKAAMNITPVQNAKTTQSDSTIIEYAVDVINSGNGDDIAYMSVVSTQGWTALMFSDESGDRILQQQEFDNGSIIETPAIVSDGRYSIIIRVYVPRGEDLNGIKDTTILVVKSGFDTMATNSGQYITTVSTAGINAVNPGLTVNNPTPAVGQQVTYSFTLTNNGSVPANGITLSHVIPTGVSFISGTTSSGSFNGSTSPLLWTIGTLSPGQSVNVTLTLQVNNGVTPGTVVNNNLTVRYTVSSNSYFLTTNIVPVTVSGQLEYGVQVTPFISYITREAGDSVWYRMSIRNSGSFKDLIELSTTSTRGLTWTLFRDANNNSIWDPTDPVLTNTNDSAGVDIDSVANGDSVRVFALAPVPLVQVNGSRDSLRVTARSAGNPLISDSKTFVTTVSVPVIELTKSMFPVGNQPAGSVVTYTISYSNSGGTAVNNFSVTDVTPPDTRYLSNSVKVNGLSVADNSGIVSVTADQNENTVITVAVGALGVSNSGSVEFKVKIK